MDEDWHSEGGCSGVEDRELVGDSMAEGDEGDGCDAVRTARDVARRMITAELWLLRHYIKDGERE